MSEFRLNRAAVAASVASIFGVLLAGCGGNYRPVVTPITPSGPAAQPQASVMVVSTASTSIQTPAENQSGIATVVDYSGDTVMAQIPLTAGPLTLTADSSGSNIYTINTDGTLTNFPISQTLQSKQITTSTLPSTSGIANLYAPVTGLYAADVSKNFDGSTSVVDVLTGSPETYKQSVTVAQMPVFMAGIASAQTLWSVSQNTADPMACTNSPRSGAVGTIDGINTGSLTVAVTIPAGKCPVYGVSTGARTFILNRGDDTITVLNTVNNAQDYNSACVWGSGTPCYNLNNQPYYTHPVLPLSSAAVGTSVTTGTGDTVTVAAPVNGASANLGATAGPVYAEYNATTQQLAVANYDGSTVSIIDVSIDEYGNDSPTFGTTYTVSVGANPASVTILYDGTRAYSANQTDGTISLINMSGHNVYSTIAVPNGGHPRTVASIQNSQYGKVYIVTPDTNWLTMIRTDQDILVNPLQMPGNIVDVRTGSQNGSTGGNAIYTSRQAGWGEPCFLAPATIQSLYGTATPTLSQCQSH